LLNDRVIVWLRPSNKGVAFQARQSNLTSAIFVRIVILTYAERNFMEKVGQVLGLSCVFGGPFRALS
jgi:hypothetical protein